jgi:hypothetical protein
MKPLLNGEGIRKIEQKGLSVQDEYYVFPVGKVYEAKLRRFNTLRLAAAESKNTGENKIGQEYPL